jgi:hypothetical protein
VILIFHIVETFIVISKRSRKFTGPADIANAAWYIMIFRKHDHHTDLFDEQKLVEAKLSK